MARLERIKRRLENWALWVERSQSSGLGFATRSILLTDAWSRGSYNGMMIPIIEQEAEATDEAVQALKLSRSHLYVTLECIYLRDLGIKGTAARMQRAESTIKAQLEQADHAIAAWLDDKAAELDKKRAAVAAAAAQRSFTT